MHWQKEEPSKISVDQTDNVKNKNIVNLMLKR